MFTSSKTPVGRLLAILVSLNDLVIGSHWSSSKASLDDLRGFVDGGVGWDGIGWMVIIGFR